MNLCQSYIRAIILYKGFCCYGYSTIIVHCFQAGCKHLTTVTWNTLQHLKRMYTTTTSSTHCLQYDLNSILVRHVFSGYTIGYTIAAKMTLDVRVIWKSGCFYSAHYAWHVFCLQCFHNIHGRPLHSNDNIVRPGRHGHDQSRLCMFTRTFCVPTTTANYILPSTIYTV